MSLSWRRFIWRSWKNVFEAWELFWSSLTSLKTFECHYVLLCTTLPCDGGCLALLLGVWWCFVSSLHLVSWQQRPLALCGVLWYLLHHGACVVVVLCALGPPLDTPFVTHSPLPAACVAYSAPILLCLAGALSPFYLWLGVCVCRSVMFFLPFVQNFTFTWAREDLLPLLW